MKVSQPAIVASTTRDPAAPVWGASGPQTGPGGHEDNATIAAQLRKRDPKILDQLILQHQHRLLHYLVHLTGSRELAEDLFQETWMRVLERGSQFRGDSKFVTWLFSIARNLVFDLRRRTPSQRSFEEMTENGDERWFRSHDGARVAFDRCAARENERLLARALPALTAGQREVFMLRFQQEMPLQEIATLTGAPLSTVKARLYRGLAVLKLQLARNGAGSKPAQTTEPSFVSRSPILNSL